MNVLTVLVTAALALLFIAAGAGKIAGARGSVSMRDHLGVPARWWLAIGLLEIAGAAGAVAGLAWTPLGVAAAAGLALLSVGAAVSHVRVRDTATTAAPALVALVLAAFAGILLAS
ncbi:DoxX family protein [Nocardioides sp.]|jgi:uncharacterized membrane protein YhaH (DUF805 family)|uniref:DoxX family protein n=1 Tax=Nocardioides sp. TaxID=35761 RepID=UPI0031FEF0A7|nr:hypothetical protein [Nocardioides sp.]